MAMAVTEAHERRWINTTWELQRQQNPENPEGMRDGEAGAGGDCGSALLSSRVDWELKDWESIPLAYPTSDENCCSTSSLPETVMVSAAVVKSEPQAEVEESEEEEEEEEEEVVHQAPEAAAAAAAAPLKLGLKLGRRSSSSSTEKNKKDKEVSQGSCSTKTPTAVIAPPTAAVAVAVAAGSSSSSPPSTKKQRVTSPSSAAAGGGGGGGNQNPVPPPRCQVEGCTADLSSAKDYHRRHKVCEMHSKASKAIAAGREQRFCQQCSRFHVLTEFDEIKRSCRRRLAGHNERRRKPHPESSSAAAAAAAAAAINLSFNCRISSPMRSTDAFHIHGTAADSLTLDDCKQIQQIQGSQGGGRPLSSPDLHDDDEHSNHHHPFANVLNLSSPWRPGENVRSPQHIQQVEEKEGQLIMLDRRYCAPSSNRLLMFLQSPRGQMRGALDPSPDVGLSNLSPLVVGGGGGSSQEFVDGAKGSLCQNLSLGGGGGWENNNHHNYHHNQGCESQSSGCALSLLSWGTTPCPPALDLCVDNTSLDHHHHHQLVADNNMGSNTVASFATHHLPQQQTQEHYLAFEKLFSAQSGGLGGMGISDIRITDIQQQQQPLEQSQLHGVGGGGGDDGASGNFLSYLGGLGLDAGNSMLALFQSSHDLQGMRSGVSSAHQSLKVTSDLVRTPSLQVHQQHHLHQVHTTTSVHSQMQTSFNGGGGEYGEFGPPLRARESSLFSTQHML